jgi:hypothetical protein
MIHWMMIGSASWMMTPSPMRPATPSARGPYAATYIGIGVRPWAQPSSSSFPFQSTGRPFMRSFIIVRALSNSAIFTGCCPITRRAESPRPMPITIRPSEMSCSVAYALAVTVGSRVPGFVTQWPSFSRSVCTASSVRSG